MLIRTRLILRFTLLVLVILALFASFVYWFSALARERRFADRLRIEAELSARILLRDRHLNPAFLRRFRPRDVPNMVGDQLSVFDAQGRIIYISADSVSRALYPAYFPQMQGRKLVRFADDDRETIGIEYDYDGHTYTIFAGGTDDAGFYQLYKLRLILLVGTAGALVLSVLMGWYFAGRALYPMARVVRQVRHISADRLSLRVDEGNGTDEIAQLAITFNQMLNGLQEAFAAQRSFVAHASHELRTPLTVLLGTLETAAAYDRTLPTAQASIDTAITGLRHLIELTNGLLALAQADDSTFRGETVAFDDCLLLALDYCRATYPTLPVQLTLNERETDDESGDEADAGLFAVRGNRQLLTTAVHNVLDNALKFSGQPVTATLDFADARTLRLTIADTGPGLTAEDHLRAFEPLYRARNGAQRPGHGLGLAVTRKVVELHGGTVALAERSGGGTVAVVLLPLA